MTVETLPRDWISIPFLQLLFQNLIVEERADIRDASLLAWRTALSLVSPVAGWMESQITPQIILDWYAILMTPLGLPIDTSLFYRPSIAFDGDAPERHNVDKNMLAQDLALITTEVIYKARIAASNALAFLLTFWPSGVSICYPYDMSKLTRANISARRCGSTVRKLSAALFRFYQHASKAPVRHHCGGMGSRV